MDFPEKPISTALRIIRRAVELGFDIDEEAEYQTSIEELLLAAEEYLLETVDIERLTIGELAEEKDADGVIRFILKYETTDGEGAAPEDEFLEGEFRWVKKEADDTFRLLLDGEDVERGDFCLLHDDIDEDGQHLGILISWEDAMRILEVLRAYFQKRAAQESADNDSDDDEDSHTGDETKCGRFVLQSSKQKDGRWVCTDTINLVVITFDEHRFNDTQHIDVLQESKFYPITGDTATQLARILREMADWLLENHPEIL